MITPQVNGFAAATNPQGGVGRRVAIYVGRGEFFVLKVEENPPEWDDVYTKRLSRAEVLLLLPVLRVLNIKIKDLTGGELDDGESEEVGGRAVPSAPGGPTRAPEDIQREWKELLPGGVPPSLDPALGNGGERDSAPRPKASGSGEGGDDESG